MEYFFPFEEKLSFLWRTMMVRCEITQNQRSPLSKLVLLGLWRKVAGGRNLHDGYVVYLETPAPTERGAWVSLARQALNSHIIVTPSLSTLRRTWSLSALDPMIRTQSLLLTPVFRAICRSSPSWRLHQHEWPPEIASLAASLSPRKPPYSDISVWLDWYGLFFLANWP